MRFLESYYPEGGFVTNGAALGDFVVPDFPIGGSDSRWFLGIPSFGKCQYAKVSDDAGNPAMIDAAAAAFRKQYPGIPQHMLDRVMTSVLMALARSNVPVGTVLRVFANNATARLAGVYDEDLQVELWNTSPFGGRG